MKDALSNLDYHSETPISTAQDVTTTPLPAAAGSSWSDYTAQHMKLDNAGQLKIRNQASNAAKPNTDTSLPNFEANEPEDLP